MLHWKQVHFCKEHGKHVDVHHIDDCEYLLVLVKPTHYNEILKQRRLFDLEEKLVSEIWSHFNNMLAILHLLEANGTFIKVSQIVEETVVM